MASSKKAVPIVVGVGDFKNRSQKVEDAMEPLQLMLTAIKAAIGDTGLSASASKDLQSKIDSVDVVATWTWNYFDLPGLVSKGLGVSPRHKLLSEHGGNSPGLMFDDAARRLSNREAKVAVVTGGEALASFAACAKAKKLPPPGWQPSDPCAMSVSTQDTSSLKKSIGSTHMTGMPIHVYPMYETAFRAHRGQSLKENNQESAQLYGEFAKVAANNQYAWNYGQPPASAEAIGTVSAKNRLISTPYPLLMNAFNTINLAGACILTTTDYAEELGIDKSKWIYALGGAGTAEADDFWERSNFYSSIAISKSIDAGLEASGLTKEDIDLYDFYSCFPIVPKLASHHLGLPIVNSPKRVTLLGGLTSFGGAGNNYALHSITAMVRELRAKSGKGLVLANGGMVTHEHVICLSSQPRQDGKDYPAENPLPHLILASPAIPIAEDANGKATIETYIVEFKRDGSPLRGDIVGRLENGQRFIANHGDDQTLKELASQVKEQVGRKGVVKSSKEGRNLFTLDIDSRL